MILTIKMKDGTTLKANFKSCFCNYMNFTYIDCEDKEHTVKNDAIDIISFKACNQDFSRKGYRRHFSKPNNDNKTN